MAERVTGHFGEFIQGITKDGALALISVPCENIFVKVSIRGQTITLNSAPNSHLQKEIQSIFHAMRIPMPEGIEVESNMPIGGGAGYSTALRLAIIKSVMRDHTPESLLSQILKTEQATDPLMFENFEQILWRSRGASIIEKLHKLPAMEIIGGFGNEPVFTDPHDLNFAPIDDLILRWKTATSLDDISTISTESARRNLIHRGQSKDPIFDLAQSLHAKGVVIAHTGSARGLIFPQGHVPTNTESVLTSVGLSNINQFQLGG